MSATIAAAMASLRMPSSLALTEVCTVSLSAMREVMPSSVAFDQVALPAGAEELRLDDRGHEVVHLGAR